MTQLVGVDINLKQWVWNVDKTIENGSHFFLRTCRTVSRKPCLNRWDKNKRSKRRHAIIIVARK